LSEVPGKKYFQLKSTETGFIRDPLEKVYRLCNLLKDLPNIPSLNSKLALKGGTAIQLGYFGLKRLSVDVDFNYVGSLDRDEMEADRVEIRTILEDMFREHGYIHEPPTSYHAEEQFFLYYTNSIGNRDKIKFEINYVDRLPSLPLEKRLLEHPFELLGDVNVLTYPAEELFAGKVRATLERATPRDLYDMDLIIKNMERLDEVLLRKLSIFFLCLSHSDARRITNEKIRGVDNRDFRRYLSPMLRKDQRGIDFAGIKNNVCAFIDKLLSYDSGEIEFLDVFYKERRFEGGFLFGDLPVERHLANHPMVKWRFIQLEKEEMENQRR